jgi:hypothetical protein
MRSSQRIIFVAASALLAAFVATLLSIIPTLAWIEEPWNIVAVSQALSLARTTFIMAIVHALLLGLPLFFLVRSKGRIGAAISALGGFIVGAVPFGILTLISMIGVQHASSGGRPTVINGVLTPAGWTEYAYTVGAIGLLGVSGGLIFWLTMRICGQIADRPDKLEALPSKPSARSWSTASAAFLLSCATLVLPSVVKDYSCHNLFIDGRTSVGPQIRADLKLPAESWSTLRQIFVDFGAAHALSFRSDEQIRRGTVTWRDLNLCNEAGVNIDALDQPWLARMPRLAEIKSPLADRGISLSVYALQPDSDWRPLARELIEKIDTTWPQKVTFSGPDGKVISVEQALKGRQ